MSSTRLLILGLVRTLGTAHGYLIHGELRSWGADEWANVKWGSIYHALRQLAKEGRLVAHDATEPAGRIDYTIAEEGEAEFFRLLRTALREPNPRPDMLAAGLAFLPALRRDDAVGLLRGQVAGADAVRGDGGRPVGAVGNAGRVGPGRRGPGDRGPRDPARLTARPPGVTSCWSWNWS